MEEEDNKLSFQKATGGAKKRWLKTRMEEEVETA